MRSLIYLILLSVYAYSASLTLNEVKDNNKFFSLLHIKDEKAFLCEIKMRDFRDIVVCEFSKNITKNISKKTNNFSLNSFENKIQIIPNHKIKLQSLQDDFITTNIIKLNTKPRYRHWIITVYKNDAEFLKQTQRDGIDFDITFSNREFPYVGSLDLNALPILQKNDALTLSRIKEQYLKKNYQKAIDLSDMLLDKENSVFFEEAKLFKLRSMDAIAWESDKESDIDTDRLVDLAKEWIDENPSSKNLPEVLMYISKTYYKLGYINKANEYSNILKDEFYDSKFAKLAQIYKADRIYENRKRRSEALEIYKDVLYNTKDVTIASDVASKLTDKYLDIFQAKLAGKFYKKVVEANELYVKKYSQKSYEFAKRFAEAKEYDLAINIAGILLSEKDDREFRQSLQKDISYWFELSGKKHGAIGLYRQYLLDYPNGSYVEFVENRLDKIVFDVDEKDLVKKMANIDTILAKYPDDPIYKKALVEKAQMLVEAKDYDKLFKIEKELKANKIDKFLSFAAQKKISIDLKNDKCKDAIYLKQEYNAKVEEKFEPKFFECLMRSAKYKDALDLSSKYLKDKKLAKKLEWMYKALQAHSRLDENKKVIMLGEDIEKLSDVLKTKKYQDIVYQKAKAYYNLQDYDEMMLREVIKAEKLYPKNIKNIDLFVKVLRYAKNRKNDTLILTYAKKIIELQKAHKISSYSPRVELDYINALKRLKLYDKALKEDLKLLYIKLSDEQRANVLYIAGELSLKIGKKSEAKEFFMKCGEIVNDSSWQKLCAENLKLLDEF